MGEGWGGNNYGGTYTIQLLAGTTVIASMTGADGIGQTSTLPMMALNADKSAWGIFGQSFNCTSTAIDPSLNGQALSIAFSLTGWTSLGMANLSLTETPTLIPGDINGDGLVDVADYNIWAANVGKTGATWAQGDLNGDGLVDVADYNIWAANVGRTSATPEPISMIILAIGGGLVALKRSSILRPQTQGRNG